MTVPDYTIGAERWPGLAKLAEECGELLAVIGRLMAFPDGTDHPDRGALSLVKQLEDEMGDVRGALTYVCWVNAGDVDERAVIERSLRKANRFLGWHGQEIDALQQKEAQ